MRILWCSDNPIQSSAYAQQTFLTTPRLVKFGHEITIFAVTHIGAALSVNGIKVIGSPDGTVEEASSMLNLHAAHCNADIVLTFKDPYVYKPEVMRRIERPWVAVVPVDTEPLAAVNAEVLAYASAVIAVTRNGQQALEDAGFKTLYVPHGFDANVFDIKPRADPRQAHGLKEDAFVALYVGDNRTWPSRKNIEGIIAGWALHLHRHPDSILVLHTRTDPGRGGLDVIALLQAYDIPDRSVVVSDQYTYATGFPPAFLASMYNAADVLLLPSTGEGFGCPIVEAALCGTPAIVTDWTAMRETCLYGTKIPTVSSVAETIPTGQMEWFPFGGWRFRPNARSIAESLEMAYEHRGTEEERQTARNAALRYEINHVVNKYWAPALETLDKLLIKGDASGLF